MQAQAVAELSVNAADAYKAAKQAFEDATNDAEATIIVKHKLTTELSELRRRLSDDTAGPQTGPFGTVRGLALNPQEAEGMAICLILALMSLVPLMSGSISRRVLPVNAYLKGWRLSRSFCFCAAADVYLLLLLVPRQLKCK